MFVWDVLNHSVPESVRFCIGDLPVYIFFIPTHPYIILQKIQFWHIYRCLGASMNKPKLAAEVLFILCVTVASSINPFIGNLTAALICVLIM